MRLLIGLFTAAALFAQQQVVPTDPSTKVKAGVSSVGLKVDASGATVPVSGTFWQTTQPVSGTFWQTTQPVSGVGNFTVVQPTGSNLHVNCDSGCSSSAGFADNSAFTAGTTPINISGGWYSVSPTNCTTGSACAPQLTIDRKLFVQSFQGTSPWIDNVNQWGGSALGAPSNFGTTPGAVASPGVNASLFQGTVAVGSGAPLQVTLANTGANTNKLLVTADPITGTVTANAGTGNFTVVQSSGSNLHVNCDSGCSSSAGFSDNTAFTAGTTAINIAGGWYSTSPTNCTTGDACAPQLTIDRKLFVQSFQGTSPWVSSISTWAGGTLGAMANYGTSPGAVLVPGENAFVTNTVASNITQVGGSAISATAALFTQITDGTNAMGAMTNFGTTPTAVKALSANVSLFQGTVAVGTGAPLQVSLANTGSNTNKILVTPDALPANQSVNVAQVNGVTTLTGAGATGTGSQRETVAQDTSTIAGSAPGTAGTASANVLTIQGVTSMTPVQVSQATAANLNATVVLAAGSALAGKVGIDQTTVGTTNGVSLAQIGTGTVSTSATGVQRVGIAGNANATLDQAPGSAVPTNALQIGITDGTSTRVPFADPCGYKAWTYYPVNVSSNTQIVAGSGSTKVYVCKAAFPPQAAAVNFNIVESATSGNACATSPTGMLGGATAALGANVVINGGYILPADGRAWAVTATGGDAMCIFTSAAVSGVIAYVQN